MNGSPVSPGSYGAGPYVKDKAWGIAVVVLATLGVCCGLSVAGIGGFVGVLGAGVAASGSTDDRSAGAGVGLFGGLIALLGIGLLISSAIQIAGGFGIMASRRWAFLLTGILAAVNILFHLPNVVHGVGVIGVILNGVIGWYCWSRLSGKEGPTPV